MNKTYLIFSESFPDGHITTQIDALFRTLSHEEFETLSMCELADDVLIDVALIVGQPRQI